MKVRLGAVPVRGDRRRVVGALWAAAVAPVSAAAATATPAPTFAPGRPGARLALVMGNAAYPGAALANATNDARLVAATARELGFESTLLLDAGGDAMLAAVKAWVARAAGASVRLVYFAGHGVQYRGHNFLVPVDARLRTEDDLPGAAFNADDLVDRLSRFDAGVNVVVLDACRSAPAIVQVPGVRLRGRPFAAAAPGLGATAAPRGTLVAYSTAPGAVAADDPQAPNSRYTRHFVSELRVPGQPIETVFKRVRAAVSSESGGAQTPWESSSLVNDFCFVPDAAGRCGRVD